ncbi:MAG: hypothetical protein Kow00106_04200 [Anaerolineae bacterium]
MCQGITRYATGIVVNDTWASFLKAWSGPPGLPATNLPPDCRDKAVPCPQESRCTQESYVGHAPPVGVMVSPSQTSLVNPDRFARFEHLALIDTANKLYYNSK